MNKRSLEERFLEVLLMVPTERQTTATEMFEMQNMAKSLADLPREDAETILLLNKMLFSDPAKFLDLIKSTDRSSDDLEVAEEYIEKIKEAREAEKKIAN
jgi:hypothetical protein